VPKNEKEVGGARGGRVPAIEKEVGRVLENEQEAIRATRGAKTELRLEVALTDRRTKRKKKKGAQTCGNQRDRSHVNCTLQSYTLIMCYLFPCVCG
jgi:hypothetical protein